MHFKTTHFLTVRYTIIRGSLFKLYLLALHLVANFKLEQTSTDTSCRSPEMIQLQQILTQFPKVDIVPWLAC